MAYGTMGGEGQPQTQAAGVQPLRPLRRRLAGGDHPAALAAGPHLGRRERDVEAGGPLFARADRGIARGWTQVETLPPFTAVMGHAGAIVRHPDGTLEGATDPRSDGQVAAW